MGSLITAICRTPISLLPEIGAALAHTLHGHTIAATETMLPSGSALSA
jgi:hypothetical protein